MKKGCLGCLGCGCLLVILAVVIPTVWVFHWANTTGRVFLADGIQTIANEGCKYAFEPESASEIASLTKEIRDDLASGKLGVIDSYKYIAENLDKSENLQSQVIFAVLYRNLTGKVTVGKDKTPLLIDSEGAEAVKTIMYALSQGKIDVKNAASNLKPLLENKNKVKVQNGLDYQFESKQIKKDITKEDMQKVVEALKTYVKDQKLEAPAKNVSADSLAKEEVVKFLKGLKNLSKK